MKLLRQILLICISAAMLLFQTVGVSKEPEHELPPLQFGLLPYLSIHQLIKNYLPLKHYLEITLNRQVVMTTAPDYRTHLLRLRDNSYDFYLTAPHMAALAERSWNARRLTGYKSRLSGSLVVAKDSPYRQIADIKGKTIATPGPYAIVTMLAESLLQSHHLKAGENVFITAAHNNSLLAVIRGNIDAAVTAISVFERGESPQQLRVLGTTQAVPHAMFMASARLTESDYVAVREALVSFRAAGPGKGFFERSGYQDMLLISDERMLELKPYAEKLDRLLNSEGVN